jgi:CheY-like chemotaxis protein
MSPTASNAARSHVPHAEDHHLVLVVDDYVEALEATAMFLEATGTDVVTAESGRKALDLLYSGLRPCVILLDLRMPELDGWEVWRRMQQHPELANLTVVILSADPVDEARLQSTGIREFLRKPIEGHTLLAALDRHCHAHSPKMYSALES